MTKTNGIKRRDSRSQEAQEYRKWYKTKEWQDIRTMRLTEEPLCRMCLPNRITAATICDHVKPHKGKRELFFCYGNTQSLCAPHHNSTKQQIERIGYSTEVGPDGWPLDLNHPANSGSAAA